MSLIDINPKPCIYLDESRWTPITDTFDNSSFSKCVITLINNQMTLIFPNDSRRFPIVYCQYCEREKAWLPFKTFCPTCKYFSKESKN